MKYLVGFSGGTDSVFVSWYLKNKGHEVLPVNLKNTKERNKCCSLPTELLEITTYLGLPLKTVDVTKDFRKLVIENFISSYLKAKTPNPCINCNENVRFQVLNKVREELNYDFISTGHYVKKIEIKRKEESKDNKKEKQVSNDSITFYTFAIPKDKKKDQTYMLYRVVKYQNIVKYLDFPMGDFLKEEVKKIINENNIPINTEQESQNICFVPDDDYPRFIKQNKAINIPKGKIIDTNGNYLGEHKGLIYYTIGQRRGLNLNVNDKFYVLDLDWKNNILLVGPENYLFKNVVELIDDDIVFLDIDYNKDIIEEIKNLYDIEDIYGKIRYKGNLVKIKKIEKNKVEFVENVRAITKGQHLVLYGKKNNDYFVIGGGEIA